MIPFQPETIDEVKRRYPSAVRDVYDTKQIHLGHQERPSNQRKHVFDFFDGMRLIISHETGEIKPSDCDEFVHVSASFEEKSLIASKLRHLAGIKGKRIVQIKFCDMAKKRFQCISGESCSLVPAGVSKENIPHWYLPIEKGENEMKWEKVKKVESKKCDPKIAGAVDDPAFSQDFNLPLDNEWGEPDADIAIGATKTSASMDDLIDDLNDP